MLQVTEDQVRALLPMRECILRMRSVFEELRAGAAQNQPRRRLFLKTGATLHSMAGAWGKYFGTKIYSAHPKFGAYFFFLLFDAETARPLAQFEANYLGQIRTGAASGYATDILAAKDATTLAIIGSGFRLSRSSRPFAQFARSKTSVFGAAKSPAVRSSPNESALKLARLPRMRYEVRISSRPRPRQRIQ